MSPSLCKADSDATPEPAGGAYHHGSQCLHSLKLTHNRHRDQGRRLADIRWSEEHAGDVTVSEQPGAAAQVAPREVA
jgi:hypothetical protein